MPVPYYRRDIPYRRISLNNNSVKVNPKEIDNENECIKVDLRIPVLEGCKNKEVQNKINTSIENDEMEFKKQMEEAAKEYAEEAKRKGETINPYAVSTIYEVTYNKNDIISISVIYYEYINEKHYYIRTSYNYDLTTGKSLGLKDLFKEGVDYKKIIDNEIRKQLLANKDQYLPDAVKKFKGISNDQPFYLENDNIAVFFGFHEIAPITSAIPIIKIPFSNLKKELKPIYLK
ncbi:DUF3298 and DUF4163 domain-containing protein [Lutibacter sp. B2]|nr:DUF3298 and DUF4163 domain-containing protein [Lutibacter sp. B2]